MLELERWLLVGAPSRGRWRSAAGQEETVATFFESQRWPAAISGKRSFGYAGDFLRLTGRYAVLSSRWAQNSVGRQPARKRRWRSLRQPAIEAALVYAIDLAGAQALFTVFVLNRISTHTERSLLR